MSQTLVHEQDVRLSDGRTLHVYDTAPRATAGPVVCWHHGTPNLGKPPEPLFATSDRLGIRWVSFDRPGYGRSTPNTGRTIASVAADVAELVDALGIARFAVMGHSGGGPHAIGCAALIPDRVVGIACGATLAPFDAEGLDWFAGMCGSGIGSLTAASQGRAAKQKYETSGVEYDPEFTPADLATLASDWSWFGEVVGPAVEAGPAALIDDDLAYVTPWGFDVAAVRAPMLLLHGDQDRIVPSAHSAWLAAHSPNAELRLRRGDGHISVLDAAPDALEWLVAQAS